MECPNVTWCIQESHFESFDFGNDILEYSWHIGSFLNFCLALSILFIIISPFLCIHIHRLLFCFHKQYSILLHLPFYHPMNGLWYCASRRACSQISLWHLSQIPLYNWTFFRLQFGHLPIFIKFICSPCLFVFVFYFSYFLFMAGIIAINPRKIPNIIASNDLYKPPIIHEDTHANRSIAINISSSCRT